MREVSGLWEIIGTWRKEENGLEVAEEEFNVFGTGH